jgi:hypothetical protein
MEKQTTPTVPPLLNTFMRMILRSPLHWLVSDKIMLISFVGRTSGRTFTTPVSYMKAGDAVTLFTHAVWWRNLVGGAPVTLRIKGKNLSGKAEAVVQDTAAVAEGLTAHLLRNHFDAKYYHVTYDADGRPNPDEVQHGAEGVVMVRFNTAA